MGDKPYKYHFTKIDVCYSNNAEYRKVFRKIAKMDESKYMDDVHRLPDIDDETLDEYNFDESAVIAFMNYVADATLKHEDFAHLYELAAARMFSTDPQIGIAVLCSYDYLDVFYPLLVDFGEFSPSSIVYNEYYTKLLRKLH